MNVHRKLLLLLPLAAAGCVAGGGSLKVYQADYHVPVRADVTEEAEWSMFRDAQIHIQRADNAKDSGNLDQSRQESKIAADGLAAFCEKFPSSEWRMVVRRMAAERYFTAGEYTLCAAQARRLYDDPLANNVSKATAALLMAGAWQLQANADAKEGKIERMRYLAPGQRAGQPLKPRIPPEPWKRFVESADLYVKLAQAGAVTKEGDRSLQTALVAAEVEASYDNVEDARGRFQAIIDRWPGEAEAMESAIPKYLDTFLLQGDDEGFDAAVTRILPQVKAQAEKAAAAAKAPGATEEQKKSAEAFARLDEELAKQKEGAGFSLAMRLFQAGKNVEAGQAFEKFATRYPAHPDSPAAMYNAAIAWDRAKEPKKGEGLRDKLLQAYPDAKIAPQAMLTQAAALSRRGDHAGALKLYGQYLEKWPQAEQRCIALQNIGVEANQAGNKAEAARRFRAFGGDEKCAKEDPNGSAHQLFFAADYYRRAKKKADEKDALKALSELQGVTDAVAKSEVEEGKRRLKGLR